MSSPLLRFRTLPSKRPYLYDADWFEANAERIIALRKEGKDINTIADAVKGNWLVVQKVLAEAGLYKRRPQYSTEVLEQKKREAHALLEQGWKMRAVATKLEVSRNTLRYWFAETKTVVGGVRKATAAKIETALRLHAEGWTQVRIANHLGVSRGAVDYWLHERKPKVAVGVQRNGQMATGSVKAERLIPEAIKARAVAEAMRAYDAGVDLLTAANVNDLTDAELLQALATRKARTLEALAAYHANPDAELATVAAEFRLDLDHLRQRLTLRNLQSHNFAGARTVRERGVRTAESI